MPRHGQWAAPACYHVMDRGDNRETLFAYDEDRTRFLGLLARNRFDLRLCHYCLMPNHWHLVLWPEQDRERTAFRHWLTNTHPRRCTLTTTRRAPATWIRAGAKRSRWRRTRTWTRCCATWSGIPCGPGKEGDWDKQPLEGGHDVR
jgi:REP element-mobilizing transposase RayT